MQQQSGGEGPPSGTPEAGASEASGSKRGRRTIGTVALVVGAVLAVVGSVLPLFEHVLTFTEEQETVTRTLWAFESSTDDVTVESGALYGVPVLAAAVLLAVSAVLALAAPRLPARVAGPTGVAAIGAAAVLTGSVWTVGQLVLVTLSNEDTDNVTTSVGLGMGTLVVACVAALAGGVLVQHWPEQASEPEGAVVHRFADAEADVDTPPFGIPVVEDTRGGS